MIKAYRNNEDSFLDELPIIIDDDTLKYGDCKCSFLSDLMFFKKDANYNELLEEMELDRDIENYITFKNRFEFITKLRQITLRHKFVIICDVIYTPEKIFMDPYDSEYSSYNWCNHQAPIDNEKTFAVFCWIIDDVKLIQKYKPNFLILWKQYNNQCVITKKAYKTHKKQSKSSQMWKRIKELFV